MRVAARAGAWLLRTLCRAVLRALRVETTVRGALPPGPALLVANHIGWLDIVGVLARVDCVFVAKQEVRRWPIIGLLAQAIGVVFVDRARKRDLLRAIPAHERAQTSGKRVLLFAEGTTGDGSRLLPFKSALVEAAVRAGVPVVPLAISAGAVSGDQQALCWVGDETLLANLPRVWALRGATLRVHIAPAIAAGVPRKPLTSAAKHAIARRLPNGAIHPSVAAPRGNLVPTAVSAALSSAAAVLIAVLVGVSILYASVPRYRFDPPHRFAGARWYNPYAPADSARDHWWRMNLHAHSAAWGGLTHGAHSAEQVAAAYRRRGYDVVGVSNYEQDPTGRPAGTFPVYEHGWNLRKAHHLAIGSNAVVWFDLPFGGGPHTQQFLIDRLRESGALVALVHPALRASRSVSTLQTLGGYDLLEVLNHFLPPADSLWDAALTHGHAVWLLAGDDSHNVDAAGETGTNFTLVHAADTSVDAIVEALRAGAAVGVRRDPSETRGAAAITVESFRVRGDSLHVQLTGALRRVRFVADSGRVVAEWQRPGHREVHTDTTAAWSVALTARESYVRVIADADGAVLYTNPTIRWDGQELPRVTATIDRPRTVLWRMGWSLGYAWLATALVGGRLAWREKRRRPSRARAA